MAQPRDVGPDNKCGRFTAVLYKHIFIFRILAPSRGDARSNVQAFKLHYWIFIKYFIRFQYSEAVGKGSSARAEESFVD